MASPRAQGQDPAKHAALLSGVTNGLERKRLACVALRSSAPLWLTPNPCNSRVWVEKGVLPSFSGQSFVKLAVDGFKSKSERVSGGSRERQKLHCTHSPFQARGASPAWDYYASFEMVDTSATLTITVLHQTIFDTSVSRRPFVLSS